MNLHAWPIEGIISSFIEGIISSSFLVWTINCLSFIKEQENAQSSGTESRAFRTIKNVATIEKGAKVIEGKARIKKRRLRNDSPYPI
uniref:Uncharacterized protein n=1 Tax=Acrobeloides nanus TaxID=290746 RepID=A0A914DV94_9BILA